MEGLRIRHDEKFAQVDKARQNREAEIFDQEYTHEMARLTCPANNPTMEQLEYLKGSIR